jgi:hypothetical protein
LVERRTVNPQVPGSSPGRGAKLFNYLRVSARFRWVYFDPSLYRRRYPVEPDVSAVSGFLKPSQGNGLLRNDLTTQSEKEPDSLVQHRLDQAAA